MPTNQVSTYTVKIYLSGSIEKIKNSIREYCLKVGLCVTVTETLFIYSGGEEYGVEIGLLNYPRFPKDENSILETAKALADKCRNEAYQWSYLIVTPTETIWNSTREDKGFETLENEQTKKECIHHWEYGYVAEMVIFCTKCGKDIDEIYDDQTTKEIYRNQKPENGRLVNR